MTEMLEKYKRFVHQMWIDNCNERNDWSQPVLTKLEYEKRNATFLEDQFYMQEAGDDQTRV
jgi:hypothetical protein